MKLIQGAGEGISLRCQQKRHHFWGLMLLWMSVLYQSPLALAQDLRQVSPTQHSVEGEPKVASVTPLPPSRRVFSADLDRDGSDELLIAQNTTLSAWRWIEQKGDWSQLWSIEGPGVAQKIEAHPSRSELYVAWGMGKGKMVAPITVTRLDSLNAEQKTIWSYSGGRSQIVSLQLFQADNDPELELLVAHFVSKYHSRRVVLDQLDSPQPKEHFSGQLRMATSWLIADIDETPGLEEVIGRVYGEERGEYGDLSVQSFTLDAPQLTLGEIVPSARGVKGVFALAHSMDSGTAQTEKHELIFSDGWVAAYGKRAQAGLKRLSWLKQRPVVESLCTSPEEFTLFELWSRREPNTGRLLLFAQGNKGINLITPKDLGAWELKQLLATPPIVNAAIAYAGGQWWAFTPSESGTLTHKLSIPSP